MNKFLLIVPVLFFLLATKTFSQTVYVNQNAEFYHTKACKLYSKNFEAIPLWKALGPYAKRPCPKCHPPTKEIKVAPKKKPVKPKPKQPAPAKK